MIKLTSKLMFFFIFYVLPLKSQALCEDYLFGINNLQVYRQASIEAKECYVSLQPRNIEGLFYRDYLISSQGLLMVFNSYGDGPSSQSTGAREFYFFPRSAIADLEIKISESNQIQVMLASGRWATFSSKIADLSEIESGTITRDPNIHKQNRGGIEITSYDGLTLDAGFTIGKSPTDDLNRRSTFRDARGKTCLIQNRLIFDKVDVNSILKSDAEISRILKKQCPSLRVDF
jgi:hypothetical protein